MRKGFDQRYKMETDGKVKIRMIAVRMYLTPREDGTRNTLKEVAHSLNMSVAWVSQCVKRYNSEGIHGLYDHSRSGAPRRINHAVVDEILKGWRTGKLTSKRISNEYQKRTGDKLSRSYARQLARERGYKAKRPRKLHANSASPSTVRRWQDENVEAIEELMKNGYTLVAEDEATFYTEQHSNILHYAPPGKAAAVVTSESREKVTAIGLVSAPDKKTGKSSRIHVFGKNPNSELFIQLCEKALKKYGLVVMVADKASWHQSRKVEEYRKSKEGALVIILLPTGSPYLNVKELDWRQTKMDEFLNEHFHSAKELKRKLITILNCKLNRCRDVLAGIQRSPYKYNERSFVGLTTHFVNK